MLKDKLYLAASLYFTDPDFPKMCGPETVGVTNPKLYLQWGKDVTTIQLRMALYIYTYVSAYDILINKHTHTQK